MAKPVKLKRKHDPADFRGTRYRVKLFRPLGSYPQGTYCTPTGLFHADQDIVFAVTYGAPWSHVEDLPYSEVDWLHPEVVRLLGSLILTEQFPEGLRCRFYPLSHGTFTINEDCLDLTAPATAQAVKKALLKTVDNPLWPPYVQSYWEACAGKEFHLFDPVELSVDLQFKYWERISIDNHVLMRGLQALIKSDMLAQHQEFQEEATIATFIALDASFELVLRHLRTMGNANPSSQDAGDWLYQTFDEPLGIYGAEGLKYFEDFYMQRVQTVHPASRYGEVPFAPVMVDDHIHLRQALPQIFGYLVLGEHSTYFWQKVEEQEALRNRPIPPCSAMTE